MSPGGATLLLFAALTLAIFAGAPLAIAIGFASLTVAFMLWGPDSLNLVATSTLGVMQSTLLLAIPLFILMAKFLQKSGLADDLYDLMYHLLGRMRGGLGVGSVLICTLFAAMSGVSAAATVSMGVIALPSMLKRGYSRNISMGSVMAGGALGVLMPPSIPLIVYGLVSRVSVGKLFAGAILPGFLLSALFIAYIIVATRLWPSLGPSVPPEERIPMRAVLLKFGALVLPLMIIVAIFGSMFSGLATPTEASAIGALGAIVSVAIRRELSVTLIWECCTETLKITAMIMWIICTATWLGNVYAAIGGPQFILQLVQEMGAEPWVILVGILAILIVLGVLHGRLGNHPADRSRLRPHHPISRLRPPVVRSALRGEHGTRVPDTTFRDQPLLHEGDRAAGDDDGRHLPLGAAVPAPSASRARHRRGGARDRDLPSRFSSSRSSPSGAAPRTGPESSFLDRPGASVSSGRASRSGPLPRERRRRRQCQER